jgi:hypothetical protein
MADAGTVTIKVEEQGIEALKAVNQTFEEIQKLLKANLEALGKIVDGSFKAV